MPKNVVLEALGEFLMQPLMWRSMEAQIQGNTLICLTALDEARRLAPDRTNSLRKVVRGTRELSARLARHGSMHVSGKPLEAPYELLTRRMLTG